MSSVTDIYTKNYSPALKKEFEDRVREMEDGVMSEEAIASMVAAEFRNAAKKKGGLIGKPLGAGGLSNAAGYSPVMGNNKFGYPSGGIPVKKG